VCYLFCPCGSLVFTSLFAQVLQSNRNALHFLLVGNSDLCCLVTTLSQLLFWRRDAIRVPRQCIWGLVCHPLHHIVLKRHTMIIMRMHYSLAIGFSIPSILVHTCSELVPCGNPVKTMVHFHMSTKSFILHPCMTAYLSSVSA